MGCIYVITNKTNGKQYVGQTSLDAYERWGRHILDSYRANRGVADHQKSDFHKAIVKYTPEAFTVEVLEECNDKDLRKKKEEGWIEKLNTFNNGYNMNTGQQRFPKGDKNPSHIKAMNNYINKTLSTVEELEFIRQWD